MSTDPLVLAARRLIDLGPDGFSGPDADDFVAEVGRRHPARETHLKATAEAISQRLPGVSPDEVAAGVYENFIWTHFVCKLLMTVTPAAAVDFTLKRLDISELSRTLDASGTAILSGFHYTGYPLVALGLAVSPVAPLISKARVDVLDKGSERLGDQVVYLSDRSAALQFIRGLKQGRPAWLMVDVVLPSVRVVKTRFLGRGMDVVAGMGKIAKLSGRPCIPLFWELTGHGAKLITGSPILAAERSEEEFTQDFVTSQAAFIAQRPTQWLEWYSVLDDAPRLRAEVKRGNDELWARLAQALQ
ncbi:hypothetical protein AQJ91_12290 [Streptomyces dysideae]|uniref:Lipid A biosynthesis acyltransferase n=2 Tax=Streptomyces dysideae TaxID=909626 RepID=A0A101V1B6_9ACTN|nr:hypothetical protein AQJ91_12290 [Streptomyces dysideae]